MSELVEVQEAIRACGRLSGEINPGQFASNEK